MAVALVGAAFLGCGTRTTTPPAEATIPPGLVAVWALTGSTAEPPLFGATYFNDPHAPRLATGAVIVGWSCAGAGTLLVTATWVAHQGPVRPSPGPSALSFALHCPNGSTGAPVGWQRVPGLASGGENVVMIRPGVESSGPITYSIVMAQESR